MDVLVLSVPVTVWSEPPCGAFTLACALAGWGREVGMCDLSSHFYADALEGDQPVVVDRALTYLRTAPTYDPTHHAGAAAAVAHALRGLSCRHPGWRWTPMDVRAPWPTHDMGRTRQWAQTATLATDPYLSLWEHRLAPVLRRHRPKHVALSVAYLSQVHAAASAAAFLERWGVPFSVGGALPRSLEATGRGADAFRALFSHRVDCSNGATLAPGVPPDRFLHRLAWPAHFDAAPYVSSRFILPLSLSSGCYWHRCRFCPDADAPYAEVAPTAWSQLLASLPAAVRAADPVVHLVDSALPPRLWRQWNQVARAHRLAYFGFARPERRLLTADLLTDAANAGCLMLQLGAETGSDTLLRRFRKGITADTAATVIRTCADLGMRTYTYWMFGLPGETDNDRRVTLDLLAGLNGAVDFLNLSLFNLPVHCELTRDPRQWGIELGAYSADAGRLELYLPFTHRGRDVRRDARRFLEKHLVRHPDVRPAVQRTPRWFRAAHLALMALPGRRDPAGNSAPRNDLAFPPTRL